MTDIFSAKQVGNLSYYVGSLSILRNIIQTGKIKPSPGEINPITKKKESFCIFLS